MQGKTELGDIIDFNLQDLEVDIFDLAKFCQKERITINYFDNDPEYRQTRWSILQQLNDKSRLGGCVRRLALNQKFKMVYLYPQDFLVELLKIQGLPTSYDRLTLILLHCIFKHLMIDPLYHLFAFVKTEDIPALSDLVRYIEEYCPAELKAFRPPGMALPFEEPFLEGTPEKYDEEVMSTDYDYYRSAMLAGLSFRGDVDLYYQVCSKVKIPVDEFYQRKIVTSAFESGSIEMIKRVISVLSEPHTSLQFIAHAKNIEVIDYLLNLYDEEIPSEVQVVSKKEIIFFLEDELADPTYTGYLFHSGPRLSLLQKVLLKYYGDYRCSIATIDKLRKLNLTNPSLIKKYHFDQFLKITSKVEISRYVEYPRLEL